jgi:PAS domain S-box-containing protein
VDYSIGFTELNGRETAILTVFDTTERKQSETALRISEERFSRAFQESGTPHAITSLRDRRVIEANAAWLSAVGLRHEQVIGRTSEQFGLQFTGYEPGSIHRRLIVGEAVRDVEMTFLIGASGEPRKLIALLSGVPVEVDGEPCVLWGQQDITALKQKERELRDSQEQLRSLAARLQTSREENRAHVAREIHDELGQALTGLKLQLRGLEGMLRPAPPAAKARIASMLDLIGATMNNVRRIATELRPGILDDFGLVAALEWQAQEFSVRTGVVCELAAKPPNEDNLPVGRDRTTAFFRIFQEALTNVARHAEATRVVAELIQTGDSLVLQIRDNGRGITPAESSNARSLGLLGMRERAQMFGGTFDIQGEPGKGTTITVGMPLEPTVGGNTV